MVEPDPAQAAVYDELFPLYRQLYFALGQQGSEPAAIGRRPAGAAPRRGGGEAGMSRSQALRSEVLEANLELVRRGLVVHAFGNASGIDRDDGLVVIKPSGVAVRAS